MKELLNDFEKLLNDVNDKANEIIEEAERLQKELDTLPIVNGYANEERDREREILGI